MTAIARRFHDETASVAHLTVLSGMAVVEMALAGLVFLAPSAQSVASSQRPSGCRSYVEVRSAIETDTISLWSSLTIDRWKTGELSPGGQALVLAQNAFGYDVVTDDGIKGWVSNFQVSRTLRQDTVTQRPCAAH